MQFINMHEEDVVVICGNVDVIVNVVNVGDIDDGINGKDVVNGPGDVWPPVELLIVDKN